MFGTPLLDNVVKVFSKSIVGALPSNHAKREFTDSDIRWVWAIMYSLSVDEIRLFESFDDLLVGESIGLFHPSCPKEVSL